jgi:hypothetical protein
VLVTIWIYQEAAVDQLTFIVGGNVGFLDGEFVGCKIEH